MRKKYLSALLFGALLVTSAGTFTSCKDYDDEINNLQEQITANADAIKKLQEIVDNGDYVTNVEKSGEGIVVTFKNGGTQTIALEDKVGSVVTVSEDGVLWIDNEPTEIKVCQPTPATKAPVKIDGGFWAVLNEDGEYEKTNIPVSGVSLAGDEQTGFTLTIVNADGTTSSVELPTAASSLVDLMLPEVQYSAEYKDYTTKITNGQIALATYTFANDKGSDWKGDKKFPAKNSVILAQVAPVMIQINPVNIDAKDIDFTLINSENKTADVDFEVKDYTGLFTGSRAANENGLYDLTVADMLFASQDKATEYTDKFNKDNQLLALAAGKVRSEYKIEYQEAKAIVPEKYSVKDGKTELVKEVNLATTSTVKEIKLNKWYTVTTDNVGGLYDMYLAAADKNDAVLFGLEFQKVNGECQVRATKTPDNITKPGFAINAETVDKNGNWETTKINFVLSEVISDAYVYELTKYQLQDKAQKDNSFSVAIADMTSGFNEEQLALWNKKLDDLTYKVVDEKGTEVASSLKNSDYKLVLVKDGKDLSGFTATNIKEANTMSIRFDNTNDLASALELNKTYYVVVECLDNSDNVISTAKIPFILSIPSIETMFVEQAGVFVNGVANAYLDGAATSFGPAATPSAARYTLTKAFVDLANKLGNSKFDLVVDTETKVDGTNKSNALASLYYKANNYPQITSLSKSTIGEVSIQLTDGSKNENGTQKGYKQELILNVTNAKFAGAWAYGDKDAVNYSFKIKVMSPILEGKLTTTDLENGIVVPSTVSEFKVNNSHIQGETYNKEVYSIFSDKLIADGSYWKRKEIAAVSFKSANENIFSVSPTGTSYEELGADKTPVYGYATITPISLEETTSGEMEVTVTDAWGYKLTQKVKVTVEVRK